MIVVSLVVCNSAVDCMERLVSKTSCYVSSVMLNSAHSLTVVYFCTDWWASLL